MLPAADALSKQKHLKRIIEGGLEPDFRRPLRLGINLRAKPPGARQFLFEKKLFYAIWKKFAF